MINISEKVLASAKERVAQMILEGESMLEVPTEEFQETIYISLDSNKLVLLTSFQHEGNTVYLGMPKE